MKMNLTLGQKKARSALFAAPITPLALSTNKAHLGSGSIKINNFRLFHLFIEIVALSGSLTDTSEHRETSVSFGYIVNQLHNKYCLSYSSTSKQTCGHTKSATMIDQVNYYELTQ